MEISDEGDKASSENEELSSEHQEFGHTWTEMSFLHYIVAEPV